MWQGILLVIRSSEHKIQSAITYVTGFFAMIFSCFISHLAFETELLQFGIALIGFVMVVTRFLYDRELRRKGRALPFNADVE